MKKVYITRNDLFKDINMTLFNKITEVDEDFIDNNADLFYGEVDDEMVTDEIDSLSSIDWNNEEFKPYDITDKMTPEQIKEHLKNNFFDDIKNELPDEWKKENMQDYLIN